MHVKTAILLQCKIRVTIYLLYADLLLRRKHALVDVMSQISTSVQQTMEDVMLMPAALTVTAASRVPVYLDTQEMDSPVQVSHLTFTFTHINYNVFVILADEYKHKPWITSAILKSVRRKIFCTKDD